ncbi:MAG: helix-turn-helix transcriptional regulator [Eubacteriales bacterium]|nr:helix-turn-helix transcriptional regulator [Eubacteriales bacterium]
MTLGEKIISLRKARGLSQEELAITLNISRQAVSKWEVGDATPDTDKIVALADYFDVTTDWLLRDMEPAPAAPETGRPLTLKRAAPLLLCVYWCGSALGLAMLFQGRFVSASEWPSLIGLMLQILFSILPFASGMMLCQDSPAAGRDFLRLFWRVNVWLVALLPSSLLVSIALGFYPKPYHTFFALAANLAVYAAVCGTATFLLRRKGGK